LLLHKKEIHRLAGQLQAKGMALVPLRIFFNGRGLAKVELGVGKGKTQIDKRETLKRKLADREVQRSLRDHAKHRSQP
jgi:SsrA-binding protein